MISRRSFLQCALGAGALLPLQWSSAAQNGSRPNILYIFTDDQSYRTLSCYDGAYSYARTPNIDRLARKGVLFTQAFTGAKCVPSRATALTGRLQFNVTNRCTRYWTEDFRNQGYTTGMIGKWHWKKRADMHQHGNAWDWSVIWDHGQPQEHRTYYWGQSVNINGAPRSNWTVTALTVIRIMPFNSSTTSVIPENHGTCGSATAPCTAPIRRLNAIKANTGTLQR